MSYKKHCFINCITTLKKRLVVCLKHSNTFYKMFLITHFLNNDYCLYVVYEKTSDLNLTSLLAAQAKAYSERNKLELFSNFPKSRPLFGIDFSE